MKRLIGNLASILGSLLATLTVAQAAGLNEAFVTQVVSDVKLLPAQAAPRPAAMHDSVREGTAVRTGTASRSELTFRDRTITRLGANTIFSLKGGGVPPPAEGPERYSFEAPSHLTRHSSGGDARVINLVEGAMLFQVPKGVGGATIKTASVTAAVTGTTGIGEYHAPSAENPNPIIKWFCLEGRIVLMMTNGSNEMVELTAGQMVVSDGTNLPRPMVFNIATLVNSSPFFDPPPASWDLIQTEIQRQMDERIAGILIDTSAFASNDSTKMVSDIDQAMFAERLPTESPATPTPTIPPPTPTPTIPPPTPTPTIPPPTPTPTIPPPTPTPSKTGTLTVIANSDPFVIDSNTVINTDPIITKTVDSFGKIFRTPASDGNRSKWLFGSTSAFDTASGFDSGPDAHFLDNMAAFKFQSLVLDSDPTVVTAGGVTNLGLIAIDGITMTALPDGTLRTFTFRGIDTLLLATENGSIDLSSGYTFNGLARMFLYARGADSHLTVNSNISTGIDLHLFSEGTVRVGAALETTNFSSFSGGDFTGVTGRVTAENFAITSQAGNININTNAFHAASDNIALSLTAGKAVNFRMGLDLSVFESAGSIAISGRGINLSTKAEALTLNLKVLSPATFTAGEGGIRAENINFMTTGGLELRSGGNITIYGADIPLVNGQRTISGVIDAAGDVNATSNVTTGELKAGGSVNIDSGDLTVVNMTAGTTFEDSVSVGGDISATGTVIAAGTISAANIHARSISTGGAIYADGNVTATGDIEVGTDPGTADTPNFDRDLVANSVSAGGSINTYGLFAPTVSAHGALTVGDDGINAFADPNVGADLQHTITADSVVSSGGIFLTGAQFGFINGLTHGGLLTINARTLLFDDGSQGIGFTDFDGANQGAFNGAVAEAGDGGIFIVNTTGNITATADSIIVARTGLTPPDLPFGGVGGTVKFDSSGGTISLDGLIRVSQATSFESHGDPQRRSSFGGNIFLHSGLTSGQAITVGPNASLESLLHPDAPGVGGRADIISEGGDITINGNVQIERGTTTISNAGNSGVSHTPGQALSRISLEGATIVTDTLNVFSTGLLEIGLVNTTALDGATMQLHADNDFNLGTLITVDTARESSGNIVMSSGANINFDNIDVTRTNSGISSGLNFSVDANGNATGTGTLRLVVDSSGSILSDGATINVHAGQTLTAGSLNLEINNTNGQVGTGGTIAVAASELSAGSVQATINNQSGGTIADGGTIDFNVPNGANITDDATLQVLGSDSATGAAINVNGGNYEVGGTFRAFTDGAGTIGMNNASVHADVLKVGALGANGVLNIGGGTLSADTTLKLYASGSNGQLNFISDVTLGGNSAKILAADAVTIFDGVVVTVGGANAADVYTNNANYTGFGGNSSTTGTFAGAGANDPQALASAPAFDSDARPVASTRPASVTLRRPAPSRTNGNDSDWRINSIRKPTGILKVNNSGEIVSLVNRDPSAPRRSLTVPNPNSRNTATNSGRGNAPGRSTPDRNPTNMPAAAILPERRLTP
jgi:hypothetical protein